MAQAQLAPVLRQIRRLLGAKDLNDLTDGQLLHRFISQREEFAFAALMKRHGQLVLRVCRQVLHHEQDAEDAFQATFLTLARHATSIRKTEAVGSWLYRVAYRIATKAGVDMAKRRIQERRAEIVAKGDPPSEAAWRELQTLLNEELSRLPEKYRAPFVLCCLENKSGMEAARQLGWKEGTVTGRLTRARKELKARLARRGVELSAVLSATTLSHQAGAAVPLQLMDATIKAALEFTAGKTAAAVAVSPKVAALIEGASKTILLGKFKIATAFLLAVGFVAAGTGVFLQFDVAAQQELLADEKDPQPRTKAAERSTAKEDAGKARPESGHRLDADGRPLPAGAVHRLGSRRFRVEGRSDFVLPTPDGKYVLVHPQPALSASAAQGLMLVDADTGLRVRTIEDSRRVPKVGVYDAIRPAVFSPDGTKLYALAWHKSEKDGEGFAQWANFDNPCKRVLLVWDVATGKLEAERDLPPADWPGGSLIGVNVSPDGKRLYVYGAIRMRAPPGQAMRGRPGIHVLDAATGKKLQTWDDAGYPVGTIAGGKEVVTFRRGAAITAHDVETGKPVRSFTVRGTVPDVTVSPDGKTVAAVVVPKEKDDPMPGEIMLWEADTGREIRRLTTGPKTIRYSSARVVFAGDGKIVYLAGTDRILRWDLSNSQALPDWPAHNGRIADLYFRPGKNELVSSGAWDGALRRWDAATGKALSITDAYMGEVAVARTPDGEGIVAIDASGRLDLWDMRTGRVTKTLQTPGRNNHQLLFTPDGKLLLVAAQTGPNTVWDLSAGKQIGEFSPPPKPNPKADEYWWGTLCFSPDGRRLLASKFGRGTWMWTWPEKKILWHEVKEQKELECCYFPDNETMIGADWHNAIEFRDPDTGTVKQSLPGGAAHLAFSPDRRRLVTTHLGAGWRVRDGITGAVLKEVKGSQAARQPRPGESKIVGGTLKEMTGSQYFWSAAFSPSGWLLAVAADNSVRVYDTASWQEVARLEGHEGTVRTVFFGKDDATLVSASSEDGTALVWSLKPEARLEPPDPAKLWADLAGDGPAIRRGVWSAAQYPDVAIQLFREKWPAPQHPVNGERLRKLIGDLDSDTFGNREAAQAELLKLGRPAEAELRKVLAQTTSLEAKRRVLAILDRWSPVATAEYSAEDARELRAVWALELAATPDAKKLLAEWAAASVGNRLCEAAGTAVRRLERKE